MVELGSPPRTCCRFRLLKNHVILAHGEDDALGQSHLQNKMKNDKFFRIFERELALLVTLQGESIWKGCSADGRDVH